ncbi:MAG: SUMF1/EgtB/PvdO family nonheme iron enzyme [Deltaproteobacteria bacterium]|nr:SUMF1/EgtB/PvdO family nonheme iron enzyme [Deltaproteobacteria bacterium]
MSNPDTPFLKKLDHIIQDATAEDREKRTASVKDFRDELQKAVNITKGEKPKNDSTPLEFKSIFTRPKLIWSGIIVATLSVSLMTIWHLMGEPGLISSKADLSVTSRQETAAVQSVNNEKRLKQNSMTNSFVSEHIGKQHLIPGGQLVVPATVEDHSGKSISVAPLYMDEFLVTNQQYVEFLNHNLSRIILENGVVKGDGANWFLLGEVYEDYEPIVYRNEKFHISDPSYTSSPVLRVSGYGASAFAGFFRRRLPTEAELLYAMVKGKKSPQPSFENTSNRSNRMNMEGMMHEMGGGMMEWDWRKEKWNREQYNQTEKSTVNTIGRTSKEPPPASFYNQNVFGIRGLNEGIGEWVIRAFPSPSKAKSQSNMFAVIGGIENQFNASSSIPSIISRFPWEGFKEVGFRTVKSSLNGNQ